MKQKICHKLINHLTRNEVQNRLPECESDKDLANRFASYFIEKIDRIRAKFKNVPLYKPQMRQDIPRLVKFAKITENDTHNIISRMETKNFKLDKMSTKLLKSILPSILPSPTLHQPIPGPGHIWWRVGYCYCETITEETRKHYQWNQLQTNQ